MLLIDWIKLELRRRLTQSLLDPSRRKKIREKRETKRRAKNKPHQVFLPPSS